MVAVDAAEVDAAPAPGVRIVRVAVGVAHALALCQDGSVWFWGLEAWGDASSPQPNRVLPAMLVVKPGRVPAVPKGMARVHGDVDRIVTISCAPNVCGVLSASGLVWTWGSGAEVSTVPDCLLECTCKDTLLDLSHTAFTPTIHLQGRLGHGDDQKAYYKPKLVAALAAANVHVMTLQQMGAWGCAVSSHGVAWLWGHTPVSHQASNQVRHRLGHPRRLAALENAGFRVVCAGGADVHGLVVGADGRLLGWGWNDKGRLGTGSTLDRNAPVVGSPTPVNAFRARVDG